jgi:NitT/TauT family transport system substrate-binding protein
MNKIDRRKFIRYSSLSIGTSILAGCINNNSHPTDISSNTEISNKLDKITLGIDWYAEAEYGGFYQALATDIYQKYGLDVTIRQGGPSVNNSQLLMSGILDFAIGGAGSAIEAIESGIPKITVASFFQKGPSVLIAHPNVGNDKIENLKGKPIYITQVTATQGFWLVLKKKYGFSDEQIRPYNFNVTPFLQDKNSAQQGLFSSEPFIVEKEGGFKPIVFLLADYGYNPYSITLDTRQEIVEKNPDLVQRFVTASIAGWESYFANPQPANNIIKKENPEMTDDLIAYGIEKMQEYGIVTSGDAETLGIGAMTDSRWQEFFDSQVSLGIFDANTDYKQAYTLDFIDKKESNS